MKKRTIYEIVVGLILVAILFTISTFIVDLYLDTLRDIIEQNYYLGAIIFIIFEALTVVFAPLSSTPIVPIASRTYGVFITFFLFYIGNVIGSIIAFFISKKYGKKIVKKLIDIKRAEDLLGNLSRKNLFISLILLRIAVPAEIVSYSAGIFKEKISNKMFISTLLIGAIPGGIFFAYIGSLRILYQLAWWIFALFSVLLILYLLYKINKKSNPK
jgi:uncharacterized membrane protein YdjX (TVP38/TMEM64 family)